MIMGTRSRIGRINADGSITSIYTHWDGYPSHHLLILNQHYRDAARIDALLELGGLSTLAPELGEKHSFDSREQRTWCTAYGRDRNDPDWQAITSANEVDFATACSECWADYAYLWDGRQWLPREVVDQPVPCLVLVATEEA
jgi:hypothetical protein